VRVVSLIPKRSISGRRRAMKSVSSVAGFGCAAGELDLFAGDVLRR
jgi:hypothetical protein